MIYYNAWINSISCIRWNDCKDILDTNEKTESIEVNYGNYNMKDNFKKKRQIMPLIYLIEEKMN